MKTKPTLPLDSAPFRSTGRAARCVTVSAAALLSAWAAASCADGWGSPEVSDLAELSGEVAVMLEAAEDSQPTRYEGGWTVRALSVAGELSLGGWMPSAAPLEIDLEDVGGKMTVRTARHGTIGVTHLDAASHARTDQDGATVVRRDRSGRISSVLLARPGGVEDLIVQHDASTRVGYEVDLPVGWSLRQPDGHPELVEVRDPRGRPRMRVVAAAAWDADGVRWPVTAAIDGQRVVLSVPPEASFPVSIDPEWQDAGTPAHVRSRSTATLLQDGKILVIGGVVGNDEVLVDIGETLCSTEIFDPLDLTWEQGPLVPGRGDSACQPLMDHVAVPLPDGRVLVAGGANRDRLLGANQAAAFEDAWIFEPKARRFERVGPMKEPRVHHTATALRSGKVLITGGMDRMTPLYEVGYKCPAVGDERCQRCVGKSTAELFDPATGEFSLLDMPVPRACHTATLLEDDSVLLVGGGGTPIELGTQGLTGEAVSSLTLYRDGAFTQLSTTLNAARFGHVAVLRPDTHQLFVGFGRDAIDMMGPPYLDTPVAEVLDVSDAPGGILSSSPPATATAIACADDTGEGGGGGGPADPSSCPVSRSYPAAVLVRTGEVLVVGGQERTLGGTKPSNAVDAFQLDAMAFRSPKPPQLLSVVSKPVLSLVPTGQIILAGQTAPCELIDDTEYAFDEGSAALANPRGWHTATMLPSGKVLVTGGTVGIPGLVGADAVRDGAEIFDPSTMASAPVPTPMTSRRLGHTATFLPGNGDQPPRVLLVGGMVTAFGSTTQDLLTTSSAEVYDTATGTFSAVGSMTHPRAFHAAVRLADNRVLIVGGAGDGLEILPIAAEIFDPATGSFTTVDAPATVGRTNHTATLLPSGKVLVAGGFEQQGIAPYPTGELASAELFNPQTNAFEPLPSMALPRGMHTASVLPDGRVLLAGGSTVSSGAEIFDPSTSSFLPAAGYMASPRLSHAATVLPSGKVLISGGASSFLDAQPRSDAEVFDPVSEQFEPLLPPGDLDVRWDHESVLLPDGRVALIGGSGNQASDLATDSVALIGSEGTPVDAASDLLTGPIDVTPGQSYSVQGAALSSYWAASSGPYVSPTGSPIASWVPLNGAPTLGSFAPWSTTDVQWTPAASPYAGPGLLFASRHGQSSAGFFVEVERAPNGVACTDDAACDSGFCSDGVCCNERCHVPGDPEAACRVCSVQMGGAEDGVCSFVTAGQDPFEDCATAPECSERFAVCGGDGACMPCRCESRLDCADGYVCTASGSCELPASVDVGGACSVRAAGSSASSRGWGALALLGFAALLRRRSVVRARPEGRRRACDRTA